MVPSETKRNGRTNAALQLVLLFFMDENGKMVDSHEVYLETVNRQLMSIKKTK